MEWIDSCVRKKKSIEAWVEHLTNSRILLGNLNTSPSIQSILPSLSGKGAHISASKIILFQLMTCPELMRDPTDNSNIEKEAVDFLEIIGVAVREENRRNIRFSAPIFRLVFYKYFWDILKNCVPVGRSFELPMIGNSNDLALVGCIKESLPSFDRKALYYAKSLRKSFFPAEYAFHFQLNDFFYSDDFSYGLDDNA